MPDDEKARTHQRWAHLRFSIVGPLLAAPPGRGELEAELKKLARKVWLHPVTGKPAHFSVSTIERWYYAARAEKQDPVGVLWRKMRSDSGQQRSVKTDLRYCSVCFNIAETDPCAICGSDERDKRVVCVVEEPLDVLAIERTGQYRGLYHVLHGAISPVNGVRPDDLKIAQLVQRLGGGGIEELILATNPNLEGDATAMYIGQLIAGNGVRVTRLARGLPMGGDLEWADEVTVSRALEGRRGL